MLWTWRRNLSLSSQLHDATHQHEPNTTMKTATITDKQVATCEAILASKGEIVKHYPDEPEFRRASVTIRPTDSDEYPYDVIMCHENWTGARWVSICNRDEAYDLEHAIRIARDMARYFVA